MTDGSAGVSGIASQVRQYFEDPAYWATSCAGAGECILLIIILFCCDHQQALYIPSSPPWLLNT